MENSNYEENSNNSQQEEENEYSQNSQQEEKNEHSQNSQQEEKNEHSPKFQSEEHDEDESFINDSCINENDDDLSNDLDIEDINFVINNEKNKNKKHTFLDVKYYVDDFFNSSIVYKYSCALDILGSYLKGQKILYNESKNLYFYYLNCLMIPCIILSSLSTVL